MLERLPTPWGLVRLGVAPDHPQLKTVSRAFEKIAARPGFRFLGNVEVGRDVTHDELASLYDAVIYAVGSQTDRRLGIPGEDLPGSWAATELVAWYNGHPDYQHLEFDLSHERAVVIGNGNVALDVARMLALTPEELAPTDTTDAAIEAIVSSGIREIVVVGRRGPVQAAWTSTELGELGDLAGADVLVDPAELELDPASATELEDASNVVQRNVEILREFAGRKPSGKPRSVRLRFRASPVAILGDERVEGRRARPQPARARRARLGARRRDRRARGAPVRDRLSQRRVPRHRSSRRAVRRALGDDPECRRTRPRTRAARRSPVSTAPAGSNADRPASSARTRRTRPRRSSASSRTRERVGFPRATAGRIDELLAEPRRRGRHVRGLGGDRRCSSARAASRTAARA